MQQAVFCCSARMLVNMHTLLSSLHNDQGIAMTINVETESIITLGEACRVFPPRGISNATISRWIQRGVKVKALGAYIKLETMLIGGRRVTSREAIDRFIAAQNTNDALATPLITASQRRQQSEAAHGELKKIGVVRAAG